MESIQKIITITGIPSSGKSTLARELADFYGNEAAVICVDYAYHIMAKEKGVDPHEFSNPRNWQKIPVAELNRLKKEAYETLIEDEVEKNKNAKFLIIEGYGLCFWSDRLYLREALMKEYRNMQFLHIHKEVDFKTWCKQKGVIKTAKRAEEYDYLNGIASLYIGSLIVKG